MSDEERPDLRRQPTLAANAENRRAFGRVRGVPRPPDVVLPVLAVAAAQYIAVWAPATRISRWWPEAIDWFLLSTAGVLVVLVLTPRRAWPARLVVAGAVGALVHARMGHWTGLLAALSLLFAAWAVADRPPFPTSRRAAPGAAFAAVLAAVLTPMVRPVRGPGWEPVAVVLGGMLLVALTAGRSTRAGEWLRSAGRWVQAVLLVPFSILAWFGATVVALAVRPTRPASGWVRSSSSQTTARSRGLARLTGSVRPRWWTLPVGVAAGVTVVVAAANPGALPFLALGGRDVASSARSVGVPDPGAPVPQAYAGQDWYPSFVRDLTWVTDERVAWRPMAVQRLLDVETSTVSVRERQRVTWSAPECDCPRKRVWMYGGSGAFGVGQRNDHTIASELARAAYADGVLLEVSNRGMPGQLHWRNSTRFAWDLTQEPPPDVVLFYDGAEEVEAELELRRRGLGNVRAPFESFLTNLYDEVAGVPDTPPPAPPGVRLIGWPRLDDRERGPGELAAERYERSRGMSRGTADARDIPVRYYWQPSVFDVGAGDGGTRSHTARRDSFVGAAAALPDDVVDLSGTLADAGEALFADDTNHNELGARLVAEAMWHDLREFLGLPGVSGGRG